LERLTLAARLVAGCLTAWVVALPAAFFLEANCLLAGAGPDFLPVLGGGDLAAILAGVVLPLDLADLRLVAAIFLPATALLTLDLVADDPFGFIGDLRGFDELEFFDDLEAVDAGARAGDFVFLVGAFLGLTVVTSSQLRGCIGGMVCKTAKCVKLTIILL